MGLMLSSLSIIFTYSPLITNSQWIQVSTSTLPNPTSQQAIGTYNRSIFLLGGATNNQELIEYQIDQNSFNGINTYISETVCKAQSYTQIRDTLYIKDPSTANTISIFDMKARTFTPSYITNIPSNRGDACLASNTQYLFVIGGTQTTTYWNAVNTVLMYDLFSNEWFDIPSMQQERAEHSCIIHPTTNTLYVFGGFEDNHDPLSSIEIIPTNDITHQTWSYINSLSQALGWTRAVIYKHIIFIIGGGYGNGPFVAFDTVHILNTLTNEISVSPHRMPLDLTEVSTIIVDHILYVFAGYTAKRDQDVNTWMMYDLTSDSTTAQPTITISETTSDLTTTITDSTTTMTDSTTTITDSTTSDAISTVSDSTIGSDAIATDALSVDTSILSTDRQSTRSVTSSTLKEPILEMTDIIHSSNILSSTEIKDKESVIQPVYNEIYPGKAWIHAILTAIVVLALGTVLICVIGVYLYLQRQAVLIRKQTEEVIVITIENNQSNQSNANKGETDGAIENVNDDKKIENDDNGPGFVEMDYRRTAEGVRSPIQSISTCGSGDMDEFANNPNIADDEFVVVNSTELI